MARHPIKDQKLHIYFNHIDENSAPLDPEVWLDSNERSAYSKMSQAKRKREFLHSRHLLKSALRNIHNCDDVTIHKNDKGKPFVRGLQFSLSHSQSEIVLAVHPRFELGIDIEQKNRPGPFLEIAKSYFSDLENAYIQRGKTLTSQHHRFRMLWSLKESYVKAYDGLITSESVRVHFDLDANHCTHLPTKDTLSFFYHLEKNVALCAKGKLSVDQIVSHQVARAGHELRYKKLNLKFALIQCWD